MFGYKSKVVAILLVAILSLPALAGCARDEPEEVQFGCALSLSGSLEETGRLYQEGYELWKEHVNSEGGILIGYHRYQVDILYYDDESDPQKTASLVEKLITEDEVDLLLGPYGSSCNFQAAAVADEYRVPMIQGGGAAEEIFTSGFEHTFGLLSPASDYFQNILQGATSLDPMPSQLAILSAKDIFSLSAAEGAQQYAESLEYEVISVVTLEKEEELFHILGDLKEEQPSMILLSAHFEEALSFVRTAKELDINPDMLAIAVAPCDPAFVEELGADANYILGTAQWVSALPYHGPVFGSAQDYARIFREKFGEEPDYHAAAASACGVACQLALEDAATLNSEEVRAALESLDATTFYGRIRFNEQGRDTYNPMVATQIQEGRSITVWPEQLATGSILYPAPPWEER